MLTDEAKLLETLERIEALFLGATTSGERDAAAGARERVRARLKEIQRSDSPVEYQFSMTNIWSRRLFVALLRRYDFKPYRYYRQRYTTVMARLPASFVDEVLWPEFQELNKKLGAYVDDVTNRVIRENVYSDNSEPEVLQELLECNRDGIASPDALA